MTMPSKPQLADGRSCQRCAHGRKMHLVLKSPWEIIRSTFKSLTLVPKDVHVEGLRAASRPHRQHIKGDTCSRCRIGSTTSSPRVRETSQQAAWFDYYGLRTFVRPRGNRKAGPGENQHGRRKTWRLRFVFQHPPTRLLHLCSGKTLSGCSAAAPLMPRAGRPCHQRSST